MAKVITVPGGVVSVTGGGSRGQLCVRRKSAKSYVMVQCTKKDGSWGKPQQAEMYGKETPEDALRRLQENNPAHEWRFSE